jgi:hypothetical protein
MKKVFVVCGLLMLGAAEGQAEFKMPKRVYRMDELAKAKEDAESKGQPISVIFTDENTSCGLCAAASLNAADKLNKRTVVVYADCYTEWKKLPAAVQRALRSPELGNLVPKTVIMDAALSNLVAVVPYARSPEQDRLLKDAVKKLPKATPKSGITRTPTARSNMPAFSIPPAEDREFRTWKSVSGARVEAALVHERGGRIGVRRKDGNKVEILVTNLTKEDQDYLEKIRNESPNPASSGDGK